MSFFSDILEHNYIKFLSVIILMASFILDALNKSDYFYIAFFIVFIVVIITIIDVHKIRKIYKQDIIPIPVVINVDSTQSSKYVLNSLFKEIESNTELKDLKNNIKKYKNIIEDDLIFNYTGDLYDKNRLISFVQIIKYQISKIKENIPNKVEFHLVYYKRPAIGFIIGYLFESESLVLYQQNPDADVFDKVAKAEKRNYKLEVLEYTKFNINQEKKDSNSKKVLLAIKASSHEITLNADSLSCYDNVVYMKAKHNGTIALDEDWILYAREIFTQLQELRKSYKEVTITHNMPESIAVLVGMAIGNYWNITITQYERGEYIELLQLDEVRCYF